MNYADIIIVGSGIIGTALARDLSGFRASVLVLDRGDDVAEGATKANSGIVHAGYDAVPGTLKARYNVCGASLFPALCETLGVAFRKCGALVLGFSEADRETLHGLLNRGVQNGVRNLRILEKKEVLALESCLNPEVVCALDVPDSAIVSPYELAFALADDAALNGVSFRFNETVQKVSRAAGGLWEIVTDRQTWTCRSFVNCAGASGAEIHNQLSSHPLSMVHRRGQYYLLDRLSVLPFGRTLFQCPSPMGKGVLVTPTVHGNLLMGPTAEDIEDPLDTATTAEGLSRVLEKASLTWPGLSIRNNITNFSGIRAHLLTDDFVIGRVDGCPGAFEAIGIESPGLSSAPAIAADLSAMIVEDLFLSAKTERVPFQKPSKSFHDMSDFERIEAFRSDPDYGRIICRCECVTEAEIRAAIRRPVGAHSIDGVKRRTRAGMGRCQGGFCLPRVAEIISEETGIPLSEITKNGPGSPLLAGTLSSFLKGGNGHE